MRPGRLTALGAGAVVTASSLAVLTASPATSPAAAADELPRFSGCAELRQWYIDAALREVGPWGLGGTGWDGGPIPVTALDAGTFRSSSQPEAVAGPDAAVGSGDTGTNVQEAGVDEPDIAKTDGDLVVHIDGRTLVITDVAGDAPTELSRTALPRRMAAAELLLVGDRVVVLGAEQGYWGGPVPLTRLDGTVVAPDDVAPRRIAPPGRPRTRMVTLDISEPASPRTVRVDRIDGSLVSAREYDGVVRAVISTGPPALDFVHPDGRRDERQALAENRRIVRESTLSDWLPTIRSGRPGMSPRDEPLLACTDVRHPEHRAGVGTLSVVTFTADAPGERATTAVTTAGELVYSSADRLYLATGTGWWGRRPQPRTLVHAFALDGTRTAYVASGEVPGFVRDRWSFSEHDGRLRVATALVDPRRARTDNGVVVLDERGDSLVVVGRVTGMGIGEEIRSVRWFGDLAVLVTFRQVDPLYTVDLTDPTEPRVVGELKIPGFSSYLHPVGGGLLLGLGQDATRRGVTLGAQAAVFDLADLRSPRRLDTVSFAGGTELGSAMDPRAFTYLPEARTALTPVQSYLDGTTRLAVLRVARDGSLTRSTEPLTTGWDAGAVRALPVGDGRVAVVTSGGVADLLSLD